MINKFIIQLKERFDSIQKSTDLLFLLFLLMMLYVSLAVKLAALVLIFFYRRDFKIVKLKELPLFYVGMMLYVIFQLAFNFQLGLNYNLLAALSFVFWSASFLVLYQIRYTIKTQGVERVENALKWFFICNAAITCINLLRIIIEIRDINPYTFDSLNFKYFASTGDYLRGITFDISTVNNIINSFGILFFLYRSKYPLSILCFLVSMFTTSNVGNIMLLFLFLYILVFDRSLWHKSIVVCYIAFMLVFVVKISPSNLNYLNNQISSIFHLKKKILQKHYEDHSYKDNLIEKYANQKKAKILSGFDNYKNVVERIVETEQGTLKKKRKADSVCIKDEGRLRDKYLNIYTQFYGDTLAASEQAYYKKYPGKLLSFIETINAVKKSNKTLVMGYGADNFSSKLAFKATNIAIAGKYVDKLAYVSPQFRENHLKLTLRYYLEPISEHSMINFPNSVFNQLLGDYGIIGLALFFILYVGFFLKRFKQLTYGKLLLPLCLAFLLTDYWFESLTILIIFEVMMFIDLAEEDKKNFV